MPYRIFGAAGYVNGQARRDRIREQTEPQQPERTCKSQSDLYNDAMQARRTTFQQKDNTLIEKLNTREAPLLLFLRDRIIFI